MLEVHYGRSRMESLDSLDMEARACPKHVQTMVSLNWKWTGLMYNMLTWKFWLGKKDFDAAVDHAAIPHIMKAKHAPTTDRNW